MSAPSYTDGQIEWLQRQLHTAESDLVAARRETDSIRMDYRRLLTLLAAETQRANHEQHRREAIMNHFRKLMKGKHGAE